MKKPEDLKEKKRGEDVIFNQDRLSRVDYSGVAKHPMAISPNLP
jgi:hypothetical protein